MLNKFMKTYYALLELQPNFATANLINQFFYSTRFIVRFSDEFNRNCYINVLV